MRNKTWHRLATRPPVSYFAHESRPRPTRSTPGRNEKIFFLSHHQGIHSFFVFECGIISTIERREKRSPVFVTTVRLCCVRASIWTWYLDWNWNGDTRWSARHIAGISCPKEPGEVGGFGRDQGPQGKRRWNWESRYVHTHWISIIGSSPMDRTYCAYKIKSRVVQNLLSVWLSKLRSYVFKSSRP